MNYIELINQFWAKDAVHHYSDKEIALYFHLLNVCNSARWRNPFGLSNQATSAKFGWGKASFDRARNRLKDTGLLDFRAGLGRGNIYRYIIRDVNSNPCQEKGIQPDIFSERLPENNCEKGTPKDTFYEKEPEKGTQIDAFYQIEPEKGTQIDTFCQENSEKGIPTDTFSVMIFGNEYEKGTHKSTFCKHFSEKGIEKGIQTSTFYPPKPLKTEKFQTPLNNKPNTTIFINKDNIDLEDKDKEGIKKSENQNLVVEPKIEKKEKSSAKKEKENEVLELYRAVCQSFPKILMLNVKRREKIMRRLSEMGNLKILEQVFQKMEASDFLKGKNRYGWKATFDWVFHNSENWMKILEGNYDNTTAQPQFIKPAYDARFMGMLQTDLSKF